MPQKRKGKNKMSTIQKLLERAARRWEVDQRLIKMMAEDEEKHPQAAPVIAISRQIGSGGASIGRLIANQLGFLYYDRALIEEVAAQTGALPEHLQELEERRYDALSNILLSFLDRRRIQDTVYLRSLLRVLRRIGEKGRAVIIGRGAGCVLPQALRVRFVAPLETRVERLAHIRNISHEEARRAILEADYAQQRFLRHYFGCDPNDPLLYDLIINTANISLEHAAELVILRLRHTWKEEA